MGDEHQDHYSASIDLSNNCRKFYFNHLKTTEEFKKSVNLSRRRSSGQLNGTVKSRLDNAMEKLRTQMVRVYLFIKDHTSYMYTEAAATFVSNVKFYPRINNMYQTNFLLMVSID